METKALVSRGPLSQGKWAIENVRLRTPRDDEVVVEIVASGICHTDLHCGDTPDDKGVPAVFYPRVLGHEGSGYVREVGKGVTNVKPGDAVLLSFSYCGECHVCKTGPPSHCTKFFEINFMGEPVFFSSPSSSSSSSSSSSFGPTTIGGRFFGQSSFAKHTIVSSRSLVNVSDLNLTRDDLQLLAPLGCGLQTGSGTVLNVAHAGPDDVIAIVGLGGVGLAAVMAAARLAGCRTIIGIDRVASRLDLALSLGATHVINTNDHPCGHPTTTTTTTTTVDEKEDMNVPLVQAVREASGPERLGATISIDTSAHPPLVAAQVAFTRYLGQIIQVGTGMPEAHLRLHMQSFMVSGKRYFGAVQGHSRTGSYVPQMIRWWKEGKFPVERLVQFFGFDEFEEAMKVMGMGDVVKPIMVW